MTDERLNPWLVGKLACPWDHTALDYDTAANRLSCSCGRTFPVIGGVPVLLRDDVAFEHGGVQQSLSYARRPDEAERAIEEQQATFVGPVDSYVQASVAATNGIMYRSLAGKLAEYPIPTLRLPRARPGAILVDVGCNWGRWSIAASRLGYTPIGLDPLLPAVLAASRVARQLGVDAHYVCADARYLPLVGGLADVVYSYSVLQHLAKDSVALALAEAGRVLVPGGRCLIQMPNSYGLRNAYHQLRRRGVAKNFDVRYWTPSELRSAFERAVGPTEVTVDGFFNLNPQPSEVALLPLRYRAVVHASEALRVTSRRLPFLTNVADSVFVSAMKR